MPPLETTDICRFGLKHESRCYLFFDFGGQFVIRSTFHFVVCLVRGSLMPQVHKKAREIILLPNIPLAQGRKDDENIQNVIENDQKPTKSRETKDRSYRLCNRM
eukprot:696547_1